MTSFDAHRLREIASDEPGLAGAIDDMLSGQDARLTATLGSEDSLAARELDVISTRHRGDPAMSLHLASALIELLEHAGRAGSREWGFAQVILAESGWSVDLRRHYPQVRGALGAAAQVHDPVLGFRSTALLADLAQCRGDYEVAGRALESASGALASVPGSLRTLATSTWASAHARSLLGRRRFNEAADALATAEGTARECGDVAAVVRAGSIKICAELMDRRFNEARLRGHSLKTWFDGLSRDKLAHWVELEAELVFAQANVEICDRKPKEARAILDRGVALARSIGSIEAIIEAEVSLAAVALMGDDASHASAQFQAAQAATSHDAYGDLREDLQRMKTTKRFAALVAPGRNGNDAAN